MAEDRVIYRAVQSSGQRARGKTMQVAEGGAGEENHESRGEERFFEEMGGVRPGPFPPSSPPPPLGPAGLEGGGGGMGVRG